VSLEIVLPPGARLLTATPPVQVVGEETIAFELELDSDVVVEVAYE